MSMLKNNLKIHLETVRTSFSSSLSLRESFILQALFLLLSNAIFFTFWLLYFGNFSSIKGWNVEEMACLYAVVSGSYGIFTVFFGGIRYLARFIFEGDLDTFLLRPVNPLLQITGSKSMPGGWGDIFSAILLFYYSGFLSFETLPIILISLISSTIIIIAFSILTGSLAFWLDDSHCVGKQIFEFLLTFSNYPKGVYSGLIKFILFSLIPSAFIGFLPVEAIKEYSLLSLIGVCVFSFFYLLISVFVFNKGLKKYSSSNLMGFRIS
jgi:ABC-2 type transport system permease protein